MRPTRGAADRTHEGHAGKRERGGCRDHRHDVGIVLEVMGEDGGDDLGLAAETVGEERADRAVDEAGGQRLLLARPAFALEEAAGDLAGGEGLLLVVHGEREEIDPRLLGAWRRRRWRAPRSRRRWRARRRRPGGRSCRFRERADGPPSRFRHVGCQTWFIPFIRRTDAKASHGQDGEKLPRMSEKASGDPAMALVRAVDGLRGGPMPPRDSSSAPGAKSIRSDVAPDSQSAAMPDGREVHFPDIAQRRSPSRSIRER